MTDGTAPAEAATADEILPEDGPAVTRELHETTAEDDDIDDFLAELCDETLTEAERLENQFALSTQWTIEDGLLETRILRVLKEDPRTHPTEATGDTEIINGSGISLSDTEETLLHHLPATPSELATNLDVSTETVRDHISTLQEKGVELEPCEDTDDMYAFVDSTANADKKSWESITTLGVPTGDAEDSDDDGNDNSIYLVYWLPTEEVAVEEFEKPIPWNPDEYKLARLVEAIGYGPGTLDHLEGEPVVLERDGDDWTVPDPQKKEIHPAAYTDTPVPPPHQNPRVAAHHLKDAVTAKARTAFVNPYTVGTTTFMFGAVIAYALYLTGVHVGPVIASAPDLMTEFFMDELYAEGEPGEDDSEVDPEAMESLMYSMFNIVFLLTIPVVMIHVLVKMMRSNTREY